MILFPKIRSIHLCTGLFSVAFLAMYGISAVQMTHRTWLKMQQHVTQRTMTLPTGLTDARAAARDLAVRESIVGDLTAIRVRPAGLQFRVLRPGMVWQVDYTATTGEAQLKVTDTGVLGAINRIHQMHGTWHEWPRYNVWVGLLLLVSTALLGMGGTGLYLWWKSHADRRVTGAMLAAGTLMAGGLAIWMRVS